MLRKLPLEHPKIEGCANLMPIKQVMALNFADWETGEDDLMMFVEYETEFRDEDWKFVESMNKQFNEYKNKPSASAYLPVRLQEWFNTTGLKGMWFYDVRSGSTHTAGINWTSPTRSFAPVHRRLYRFCFQYGMDAMLFKLRWQGE